VTSPTPPAEGTRFHWTDARIRDALGLPKGGAPEVPFRGVATDTRTIQAGDLFVALTGPHFDGHAFVGEALARGARGAVVSVGWEPPGDLPVGGILFAVPDPLRALGALARFRRERLNGVVIGITGSSGKTTTKDLLSSVLASRLRVHATTANLNNRIGVPLTLLAAPDEAEVIVVEMGTNSPGEIAELAALVHPDVAVLTTVGASHLEGLTDLAGVMEEKLDILRGMRAGGQAIVGDQPADLPERARALLGAQVRVAGISERADARWRGELLGMDEAGRWTVRLPDGEFLCGLPGRHGVQNALLVLATAEAVGVPFEWAVPALAAAVPTHWRGERVRRGGLALWVDCYNANPQSTRAALELLADLPVSGGKVAVLGSMLELGPDAPRFHRELLDWAASLPLDLVVGIGAFADAAEAWLLASSEPERSTPSGPEILPAGSVEQAYAGLRTRLRGTETVLLKASRGVALERILPHFDEDFGGAAASVEPEPQSDLPTRFPPEGDR
jgi:UDP-N-acetylmuramoyl-tripeptide--D-alanyl-D-alanine ligase